jgi:hypothetical protein
MIWIDVNSELPKAEIPVLVCGKNSYGKTRILRACYIPKYHMEDDGDSFSGDTEYNEEKDMNYWPEGWYEWNEMEETHWLIDFEVKYWMQLPEPPACF